MADSRKIAILGAGRIGEAFISGLLSSGWRKPGGDRRHVPPRGARRGAPGALRVAATLSNHDAAAGASLVVIAVKPQDIEGLLGEIGGLISPDQTVLTVAAAIQTSRIESRLSAGVPVVRAMPNTPSTVHEGIAGLCAGAHAGDEHLDLAEEALSHLGGVVRVPESAMDAITAVSGSGPAYFALLAEAMIEAGILLGLSREISTQLVVQTMLGTAKQLRDEKMHPVELREMVTSPGGTTIAAIRELEMAGVRAAFLNAIQAAMVRARELAAAGSRGEACPRRRHSRARSPRPSARRRTDATRPARPSARRRRGRGTRYLRPATRSFTVLETSTSLGPASAATRAPMFTAIPPTLRSIRSHSPVCRPARISMPSSRTPCVIACAHRIARAGPSNDAKKPSPAVSSSVPRKRTSWRRMSP